MRFGGKAFVLGALPLLAGLALLAGGGSSADAQANGARIEGVASCAGSTCHGRAEGNGDAVRQDEIATWQEPSSASGAHSRAYAVLSSPRGRQIIASLTSSGNYKESDCLGCHTTYKPEVAKGARYQESDGVGCESCHGPASGWLASHYVLSDGDNSRVTHASNVARGMTDLTKPRVRANVCLDCHYGSEKTGQFVTHAMMAAGHPRVTFELDLFSALQQHHDEDADYTGKRMKPATDSVRLWAVGQAEAVARSTELFAGPRGAKGVFPQYYFYDCHSCHRTITDAEQRRLTFETNPGRPIEFGQAPFNDENIIMLSSVARALASGQAASFDSASKAFHAAMGEGRAEAQAAALRLNREANALAGALDRDFDGNDAFTVIQKISDTATAPRFTDYTGSSQAVMAVDTLLNALVRDGRITTGAAASIRADINVAYGAVRSPESYKPVQFRAALARATGAIGRLR
ncbi:cytochrome c family protein [Parerythrobacter lacustris]|uniref:Cytochrome c family protein n=1 Tax=Parerythrobacter lacustris TaxID=2969984 RepID=A0ABT1XPG1_9SPHN|nr:cytochrome c family protein [Parerythrobacter lacustris]MCR2832816.1 cytochrome c family protein [Parerythrobacter lacustris]